MIFGSGDIASALSDREGFTFFACGVSDSLCIDPLQFAREKALLKNIMRSDYCGRLVYFSTLSIYEKDTAYTRHKRKMEFYIKALCESYCIIRLGNITWGTNPHTIINTFKRRVQNRDSVIIEDKFKYLCTKEELNYWLKLIPDFNTEMNITGERVSVQEIYNRVIKELLIA